AFVDAWVSLAGVNEGTLWAYGCFALAPCREMVPTSSMLAQLNRTLPTGSTRLGAWGSPCDDMIGPRAHAALPGAQHVEPACLDHTGMRRDPQVLAQAVRFLGAPPARGS